MGCLHHSHLITVRNFAGVLMALSVMFVCIARVRTQERGLMTHTQTERGRNQIRVATFAIEDPYDRTTTEADTACIRPIYLSDRMCLYSR